MLFAEGYSESTQTSEIKLFTEIVDSIKPWTVFAKRFILDVWRGYEYTSSSKHSDKEYSTWK